ncbi:MAG: SdrD B-like domain-containing protein, partial [Chitinophagaceae bacterium]
INLSAAESEQDVDAGLMAGVAAGKGTIGNKIFYDLDGDGIQDNGETGVAGITITLQKDINNDGDFADAGEASFASQISNSLGEYLFTGLDAGIYRLVFSNGPIGYNISPSNVGSNDGIDSDGNNAGSAINSSNSTTGTIYLTQGEDNLSVDLGIAKSSGTTGSISDRVWFDINNDGDRDATEPGIAGVTVTLFDASGAILAVTTTDVNGYYLFDNLASKTTISDYYQLGFSNYPSGLVPTAQAVVITNELSAPDGTGKTQIINLNAGQNRTDIDFGLISSRATLGNFVWLDSDGDGVQDAGEPGITGVTVLLYFDSNNDGDFLDAGENISVASIITDQIGQYLFTNLTPGNYQVQYSTVPGGLNFTQQNTPGDNGNNTNSDANISGLTATINLSIGEGDLSIDAGLYKPTATIGNFVWADNNSDNVQDPGDQPVAGILVTLFTSSGVRVSTMVTDKNGQYLFSNIAPGNYYLGFSNSPNSSLFVSPDQGGNDAIDSDINDANGPGTTSIFSVPQASINITIDAGLLYIQRLPVRVTFMAYKRNSTAELDWKVSGDIAEDKNYIVERSIDGRNYRAIGNVAADTRTNYQQLDLQPSTGVNYYRIRIEYIDGKIEYSEVRMIQFGKGGLITIFPNPAISAVNISLPDNWQGKKLRIEVINSLGQVVTSKSLTQASQIETIDISKLANGYYTLKLINNNEEAEVKTLQVRR